MTNFSQDQDDSHADEKEQLEPEPISASSEEVPPQGEETAPEKVEETSEHKKLREKRLKAKKQDRIEAFVAVLISIGLCFVPHNFYQRWMMPEPSFQNFTNRAVNRIGSGINLLACSDCRFILWPSKRFVKINTEISERCDAYACYSVFDYYNRKPYRNQFSRVLRFSTADGEFHKAAPLRIPPKRIQTEIFEDSSIWSVDVTAEVFGFDSFVIHSVFELGAVELKRSAPGAVLMLGFGSGYLHYFFKDLFPQVTTAILEKNDIVADLAVDFYGVREDDEKNYLVRDGNGKYLKRLAQRGSKFDAIIVEPRKFGNFSSLLNQTNGRPVLDILQNSGIIISESSEHARQLARHANLKCAEKFDFLACGRNLPTGAVVSSADLRKFLLRSQRP